MVLQYFNISCCITDADTLHKGPEEVQAEVHAEQDQDQAQDENVEGRSKLLKCVCTCISDKPNHCIH